MCQGELRKTARRHGKDLGRDPDQELELGSHWVSVQKPGIPDLGPEQMVALGGR